MNHPGDPVAAWDPVGFGIAFTRAMRKHTAVAHVPSLRTSLAIPRFLFARWARTGVLTPRDYLDAAILNSPPEDQRLAEAVASDLLFPKTEDARADPEAPPAKAAAPDDPMADLLGDLESIGLDFDNLDDLSDIDALLDHTDEEEVVKAFDLFEHLYSSAFDNERSLGELIALFGGPAEFEAAGAYTVLMTRAVIYKHLLARAGELEPMHVFHGVRAGFAADLRPAIQHPWELAGIVAENPPALELLLADLLADGTDHDRGRALAFLRPWELDDDAVEQFTAASLAAAGDLGGFAELVIGVGEWLDPPRELLEASAIASPRRSVEAAERLERQFGEDLRPQVIIAWSDSLAAPPTLEALAEVAVDTPRWHDLADDALTVHIATLAVPGTDRQPVPAEHVVSTHLAGELAAAGFDKADEIAGRLATELLVHVTHPGAFIPQLDALIGKAAVPRDVDRVVARAVDLGIAPAEVWDRLGDAVEQLRQMVVTNASDASRYQQLIARISRMSPDLVRELARRAAADGNLEAMAALLAVDMGAAAADADPGFVMSAVGYKGIGGGSNLLRQWFTHRGALKSGLKEQIRLVTKEALLDQAFDWMGKGGGSGERGLVPQSQTRPFRAGDGMDALDLEGTLERIIGEGKALDQVSGDDLLVQDTARGRAAMGVLIDISGSMGGAELAQCAIAVVMLLGRLKPEEVALAVFESNTHVLKGFTDTSDLDALANQVLDLEATGGTRVDAALKWAGDEFEGAYEADLRVLFLLSDFCFFEGENTLRKHSLRLSDLGVRLLAASHGYLDKRVLQQMLTDIGGQHLELKDLDKLPGTLVQVLHSLGD